MEGTNVFWDDSHEGPQVIWLLLFIFDGDVINKRAGKFNHSSFSKYSNIVSLANVLQGTRWVWIVQPVYLSVNDVSKKVILSILNDQLIAEKAEAVPVVTSSRPQ